MSGLFAVSGLLPETDKKEVLEVLIESVNLFVRAGGVLTFKDWMELNNTERMAFIMAREEVIINSLEYEILEKVVNKASAKLESKTDE